MSQNRVRVLFVHFGDQWIRGSEIVLLDLIGALDRSAFEPVIWCNGLELSNRLSNLADYVIHTELNYYLDYESDRFNFKNFFYLIAKAREICNEYDIRLIHCNGVAPCQWIIATGLQTRIPVLAHIHARYLFRSRVVSLAHASTRLVGVSQYTLAPFRRDGFRPADLIVIKNGIDSSRVQSTQNRLRFGNTDGEIIIGAIGSLIRRKGLDILLQAFAKSVETSKSSIRLIIAGDGPEKALLTRLVEALKITELVDFEGVVSDVGGFFSRIDILAHFARDEAFGLVLIEAGFHSKPVCATNVGGIPEIIRNGYNGLLVNGEDVASAAEALTLLIEDSRLRERLGENGSRHARSHLTSEAMARSFENCYKELLAQLPVRTSMIQGLSSIIRVIIWDTWSRLRRFDGRSRV